MNFVEDKSYVLIRIKTPSGISFYDEHKSLINEYGHVWFCRFGKNNMKVDSIKSCEQILLINESGNNEVFYAAQYSQIRTTLSSEDTPMPSYYKNIQQESSLWFDITNIEPINHVKLTRDFLVRASNGSVDRILHSMCPATFLRYSKFSGGN